MSKKKFDYFGAFTKSAQKAVKYAELLQDYMQKNIDLQNDGKQPDPEFSLQRFSELHQLEDEADGIKHELISAIAIEFITPIEREDIVNIAEALDDVIDNLDNILERMYMYDIYTLPNACLEMSCIITKCVRALHNATLAFPAFKKHDEQLRSVLIDIDTLEEEGDALYIKSMHNMFASADKGSYKHLYGVGQVLDSMEKACDSCEHVADMMRTVILKNS